MAGAAVPVSAASCSAVAPASPACSARLSVAATRMAMGVARSAMARSDRFMRSRLSKGSPRLSFEDRAVPAGGVQVFTDPVDQPVPQLENEAVVVGVGVSVGQGRAHRLLHDDPVTVGV